MAAEVCPLRFSVKSGVILNLRPSCLAIICLLLTAFVCAAQTAPKPDTPDPSQTAEPASTSTSPSSSTSTSTATSQTTQTPPADKPPADTPAAQSPSADSTKDKDGKDKDKDKDKDAAGTSKDRLFFALPNFLTLENAAQVPPLTAGQKFKVVARGAFDPIQIVWYGALSGICQAQNCEPGYGQGWDAYAKRFGAYAADGTIENFFVGAILPSLIHQDPRFYQSGKGGFFNRTGYAVSRIVVSRSDSGRREFNYSEVFGSGLASAISTYSYHPRSTLLGYNSSNQPIYSESDRTFTNTLSVWGTQVAYDALTLVIKEFWPDVRKKIKKEPH
jgi:hypothetical protein